MKETKQTASCGLSLEDSVNVLRNIKRRTREYDELYAYMGEEYCRQLAEIESNAIDTVIAAIESGAGTERELPAQVSAMMPIPPVSSLDEASPMMTPKQVFERCRAEKPEWRISEMAIRAWTKTGQLPCMRSGNRTLISWATFCSCMAGGGSAQAAPSTVPSASPLEEVDEDVDMPIDIRAALKEVRAARVAQNKRK